MRQEIYAIFGNLTQKLKELIGGDGERRSGHTLISLFRAAFEFKNAKSIAA